VSCLLSSFANFGRFFDSSALLARSISSDIAPAHSLEESKKSPRTYIKELPKHDTSVQSTFKARMELVFFFHGSVVDLKLLSMDSSLNLRLALKKKSGVRCGFSVLTEH